MNQPAAAVAATQNLRVATYNIHKGVQGIGPARRLEIHNLGHAIEQLDADIVCLQEVRKMNRQAAARFARWPELPQADFLAPEGYTAVYETNAVTRHGEHGNALLTRWPVLRINHQDISDHRFEQRGLLHVVIDVEGRRVHTIVVHLGLIKGSRVRQIARLREFIDREVPPDEAVVVAGDFNDWGARMRYAMNAMGLRDTSDLRGPRTLTYPRACRWHSSTSSTDAGWSRWPARCRAAPSGLACPTTCRWWPISRSLIDSIAPRRDGRCGPECLEPFTGTIPAMLRKTDVDPRPDRNDDDEGTPVSVKIRERLTAARKRFNANDNIAEFIEPGELEALLDEVEVKMKGVLQSLVIDVENDHNTDNTARRVAKMYLNEVFRGRYVAPPSLTEFPNAEHLNELMIVGPITVRSACSHHFCPIIGKLWIGVMPNEHTNVIGLSKYARLAEWVMGRPQIQEEAVVQLADLIQEKTQPDGLALVMEAEHFCMAWRGVKEMDSKMINSVMRGVFLKDPSLRREFLSLLPRKS